MEPKTALSTYLRIYYYYLTILTISLFNLSNIINMTINQNNKKIPTGYTIGNTKREFQK